AEDGIRYWSVTGVQTCALPIYLMVEAREITFDVAAAALVGFRTGPQVDWLRERFYMLLRGPVADDDEDWDSFFDRQLKVRDELRSEEHTSELQSLTNLVCRLLL